MKYNENFNSISEILGSTLESKAEFSNLTKKVTLFSFWGTIVGKKFINSTRPYALKHGKLFVTCANSYALQDLMMYKYQLLEKLKPYAKGLEIEINDIVLSAKNWNIREEIIEEEYVEEYLDIENVKLEDGEIKNVQKMVDKLSFLNDEQKIKFKKDIENNLKAGKIRG